MLYRVRIVASTEALQALQPGWTTLFAQKPGATVFSSYEWNAAWWQHFGQGHRLFVLTVTDADDMLCAIAPLMIRALGPVRKLELIGTGLSDFGDVLVTPRHARPALAALFAFLAARRHAWDLGDWCELPPDSPVLAQIGAHPPPRLRIAARPQTKCPLIALPETWDAYVGGLERKRRYYVSSYPRKFMREHAGTAVVRTEGAEVEAAVRTFYSLHMARWMPRQRDLSVEHRHAAFLPFLEDVCARLAAQGCLRLVELRAGDVPVAASLNFLCRGWWSSYMKGFDPAWSHSRPGTVLDAVRIREAIAEHATHFDFGRGDEAYKSGFGVTMRQTTRVLLVNPTPRSQLAYALLVLRRQVRKRLARPGPAPAEPALELVPPRAPAD